MNQPLLKKVLLTNSAFSLFCAIDLLLFTDTIASLLGSVPSLYLQVVGAGLIIWAIDVYWIATRPTISTTWVKMIVAADLGWVLGTIALLIGLPSLFSNVGVLALTGVAIAVSLFALGQIKGLTSPPKAVSVS